MTYEVNGIEFTQATLSLYVENEFRQYAFNDSMEFVPAAIVDISRDPEKLKWFMELVLSGEHEKVDWFKDAESDTVEKVVTDFFTRWIDRLKKRMPTKSGSSPSNSTKKSKAKVGGRKKTASK